MCEILLKSGSNFGFWSFLIETAQNFIESNWKLCAITDIFQSALGPL